MGWGWGDSAHAPCRAQERKLTLGVTLFEKDFTSRWMPLKSLKSEASQKVWDVQGSESNSGSSDFMEASPQRTLGVKGGTWGEREPRSEAS